jgi:hypothetical protein
MTPSLPFPKAKHAFRNVSAVYSLAAISLFAGFQALGGLTGCKSVDTGVTGTDTTQVTADSAVIQVTNHIEQDPDSLTLLLFSPNAVDWTNTGYIKRLGGVPEGGTADIKVPAGTWKLAYEKSGGIRVGMEDVNAGSDEWLKAVFVKDRRYALILKTEVNQTVWVPNFETVPEIE